MNKEYSNKQLKLIIIDLYKSHNINIDEDLNKCLNLSSKTNYNKLKKIYDNIKIFIIENMSTSNTSQENKNILPPIFKEQDDNNNILYNEIKQLKKDNFNLIQSQNNYKFKICNYKKIIGDLNNKINCLKSNNKTDEEYIIIDNNKERRNIKYSQVKELSSTNLINELSKLSTHELKILYNRYFNNKLNRQLNKTN